jgi:O-antigen/teichoic acid export membrane protein
MSGRSGLSLMNTLLLFGTSIVLDWLLIPKYGLAGATIAGLSTIIFVNVLRVVEVWVTLKIHPFRRDLLKPITAGLATLGAVHFLRMAVPVHSLLLDLGWMALFVASYSLIIVALKLDQDDRLILRAVQKKLMIPLKAGSRPPVDDSSMT